MKLSSQQQQQPSPSTSSAAIMDATPKAAKATLQRPMRAPAKAAQRRGEVVQPRRSQRCLAMAMKAEKKTKKIEGPKATMIGAQANEAMIPASKRRVTDARFNMDNYQGTAFGGRIASIRERLVKLQNNANAKPRAVQMCQRALDAEEEKFNEWTNNQSQFLDSFGSLSDDDDDDVDNWHDAEDVAIVYESLNVDADDNDVKHVLPEIPENHFTPIPGGPAVNLSYLQYETLNLLEIRVAVSAQKLREAQAQAVPDARVVQRVKSKLEAHQEKLLEFRNFNEQCIASQWSESSDDEEENCGSGPHHQDTVADGHGEEHGPHHQDTVADGHGEEHGPHHQDTVADGHGEEHGPHHQDTVADGHGEEHRQRLSKEDIRHMLEEDEEEDSLSVQLRELQVLMSRYNTKVEYRNSIVEQVNNLDADLDVMKKQIELKKQQIEEQEIMESVSDSGVVETSDEVEESQAQVVPDPTATRKRRRDSENEDDATLPKQLRLGTNLYFHKRKYCRKDTQSFGGHRIKPPKKSITRGPTNEKSLGVQQPTIVKVQYQASGSVNRRVSEPRRAENHLPSNQVLQRASGRRNHRPVKKQPTPSVTGSRGVDMEMTQEPTAPAYNTRARKRAAAAMEEAEEAASNQSTPNNILVNPARGNKRTRLEDGDKKRSVSQNLRRRSRRC